MKRLLILILILFSIETYAQVHTYRAHNFTSGIITKTEQILWNEWVESSMMIYIDINNATIKIPSKEEQYYTITKIRDKNYDSNGTSMIIETRDKYNRFYIIKLRTQTDLTQQLYVYKEDYILVYGNLELIE